jgi:hypothetical protein
MAANDTFPVENLLLDPAFLKQVVEADCLMYAIDDICRLEEEEPDDPQHAMNIFIKNLTFDELDKLTGHIRDFPDLEAAIRFGPTGEAQKRASVVHAVVETKRWDLLPRIAELGFDLNIRKEGDDKTPFMRAAMLRQTQGLRLLISLGADPNLQDSSGRPALMQVIAIGYQDFAKWMIKTFSEFDVTLRGEIGCAVLVGFLPEKDFDFLALLIHEKKCPLDAKIQGHDIITWAEIIRDDELAQWLKTQRALILSRRVRVPKDRG